MIDHVDLLGMRKTTARDDNFIRQSHLRNSFKIAGLTRDELNNIRIVNPISNMTVLRRLKEDGLLAMRPTWRIRLKRINVQNRLRWAVNPVYYIILVVYGIITCFLTNPGFFLNATMGEKGCFQESMRGSFLNVSVKPKLMEEEVWWCGEVSRQLLKQPLVTVCGNLTAWRYIDEVLQPHVIPVFQDQLFTFMHDNAPAHRAAITNQFMQVNNIPVLPIACILTWFAFIGLVWSSCSGETKRCLCSTRPNSTNRSIRPFCYFELPD